MFTIKPLPPDDDSLAVDLLVLFNQAYQPGAVGRDHCRERSDDRRHAAHSRRMARSRCVRERVVGVAQGSFGRVLKGDLERSNPVTAASLTDPLFEFHQLVVSQSVRGRGLGTRMHDDLMAGLQYDAILETHPEAEDALRLYRSRGWREQGTLEVAPGVDRTIMTLATADSRH